MFTGIINQTGIIEAADQRGDLRLTIQCRFAANALVIGESIACNGCCLTVVEKGERGNGSSFFAVDLSAETIARTAPGQWMAGRRVNLERSLRLGDALDGHLVSGHVDGVAVLRDIVQDGDSHRLTFEVPPECSRFLAEKGSVTLDGVSLTVNTVSSPPPESHEAETEHSATYPPCPPAGGGEKNVEKTLFSVNIIPHTWHATTLGERTPGDMLNLEIDMIARYVARLLQK